MSQYEEAFMAGFSGAFSSEKTAQEGEMPVLSQALANLGLLEEEESEEAVDMPILKQALENLGLTGEEEEGEASSMLEALAVAYGPAVAAEREKTAAMEKDAAGMLRTKAKSLFKTLGRATGATDVKRALKHRGEAKEIRQGAADAGRPLSAKAKASIGRRMKAAKGRAKRGVAKGAILAGASAAGGGLLGAVKGKKKKKGKK